LLPTKEIKSSILSKIPPLSLAPGAEYPHEFDDALNPMLTFLRDEVLKGAKSTTQIKQQALSILFCVGLARGSFSQVLAALELVSSDTTPFPSIVPFISRLLQLDPKPMDEARKIYAGTKWGWYQDRVNRAGALEFYPSGALSSPYGVGDWTITSSGQCIAQFNSYLHTFTLSRSRKRLRSVRSADNWISKSVLEGKAELKDPSIPSTPSTTTTATTTGTTSTTTTTTTGSTTTTPTTTTSTTTPTTTTTTTTTTPTPTTSTTTPIPSGAKKEEKKDEKKQQTKQ